MAYKAYNIRISLSFFKILHTYTKYYKHNFEFVKNKINILNPFIENIKEYQSKGKEKQPFL